MEVKGSLNALVVSGTPCDELQRCLRAAGSRITTALDGQDAINRAERSLFDLTVLVSTGQVMDLVETYFNLRDINPSMEIVLLSDEHGVHGDPTADVIAHAFPHTHALTIDGLARVLGVGR
jgi:CheY-like chemotaxis protein